MKESHAVSHVKVILEAVIYQDRKAMNCWVAVCPMLSVATQSRTKSGVEHALSEALYLWFETCIQEEILDSSLRKLGFSPITHEEARKSFESDEPANLIGVSTVEMESTALPRSIEEITPPPVDPGFRFTVDHRRKGGEPFVVGEIPAALLRRHLGGHTLAR